MDPEYLLVLAMFIALMVAIFSGFPLPFALMGTGLIFGLIGWGPGVFPQIVIRSLSIMTNDVLVAVPLFTFMGYMLERSGVADGLFASMQQIFASLRGSLALVTILVGTLLAATTGIAGASMAVLGILALNPMLTRGYDKPLATGSVIAGATLGQLIPPSLLMVVYAPAAGLSVVRMFSGGIFPGLLLSGLFVLYIGIRCYLRPELGPALPLEERQKILSLKVLKALLLGLAPPLLLILSVLGTILFGLATPTEAAATGGFFTVLICIALRKFNWQILKDVVYRTISTSSMIMMIILGASIFTGVFWALGGNQAVEALFALLDLTPTGTIIAVMVILFLLGKILDTIAIIMITVPIINPLIIELGIDPLWFGMLVMVNLQIAYLTPPFAYGIFYLKALNPPGVTLGHIYRGVIPFILLQIVALILCIIFPEIVLWLPEFLYD
ncbi:MAG: TRAP transporter large permease subunit [Dethiobacter sp.]|nr:TRAP transporter large permease subunit [Dethiobacter sp.]